MSSGHWTNTGMAKFINDNLYNYKSDDEKSMNPFRWYRLQNGEDVSKYRETINGFPCRLILINDGSTPLNEGQNEPTPGNTKDMGIFNFNHDKDATKTLGFNSDIFPNCASYEVTANSDTSAGAFMSYHSNIFHIDNYNVGTTSIFSKEYFGTDSLTIKFDTASKIRIRYYDKNGTFLSQSSVLNNNSTITLNGEYFDIVSGKDAYATEIMWNTVIINDVLYYKGNQLDSLIFKNPYEVVEEADELAYLKESFELRHPDADDVVEDWGFMGVEEEVAVPTLEYTSDNITATEPTIMTDKILLSSYSFPTSESNIIKIVRVHYYNANLEQVSYWDSRGGSFEQYLTDDTEYISFEIICAQPSNDTLENVLANSGMLIGTPIKLVRTDSLSNKMIYDTIEIQKAEGTGLKALIDWVDNCTDEEFVRDFEQHFHKDYTLRYFCLVTLIGAVDNLGKNMMLDTADSKIYFPRFYDID